MTTKMTKQQIALATLSQKNPEILFDELANRPFIIRGDAQSLLIFKRYLDLIIHLGKIEHTGYWDPYLKVTLNDGSSFETPNGYPEILIEDFDEDYQHYAFNYLDEVTSIGFAGFDDDNEEEAIETYYPISDIKSIQLMR